MPDGRKSPRSEISALKRTLEKKKDGLIACLELADKARCDVARIEARIRDLQSK